MSSQLAAVFEELGEDIMPDVIDAVANGECRITQFDSDEAIDDQGFPDAAFARRTAYFIPCVWEPRSSSRSDAEEATTGDQSKAFLEYKITLPRKWNGAAVVVESSDRLELKQQVGGPDVLTYEIVGVLNDSNVVWSVYAMDLDA